MPIDAAEAVDAVRNDLEAGLGDVFSILQFTSDIEKINAPVMSNNDFAAVVWSVNASHDNVFAGLAPTGREVVIEGVTIVSTSSEEPMFRRYIDWSNVLGQLGVSISGRPVMPST